MRESGWGVTGKRGMAHALIFRRTARGLCHWRRPWLRPRSSCDAGCNCRRHPQYSQVQAKAPAACVPRAELGSSSSRKTPWPYRADRATMSLTLCKFSRAIRSGRSVIRSFPASARCPPKESKPWPLHKVLMSRRVDYTFGCELQVPSISALRGNAALAQFNTSFAENMRRPRNDHEFLCCTGFWRDCYASRTDSYRLSDRHAAKP
jgi:hypothetical protein